MRKLFSALALALILSGFSPAHAFTNDIYYGTWEAYGTVDSTRASAFYTDQIYFDIGSNQANEFIDMTIPRFNPENPAAYIYLPKTGTSFYDKTAIPTGYVYEYANVYADGDIKYRVILANTSNVATYDMTLTFDMAADFNIAKVTGYLTDYTTWTGYDINAMVKRIDSKPMN